MDAIHNEPTHSRGRDRLNLGTYYHLTCIFSTCRELGRADYASYFPRYPLFSQHTMIALLMPAEHALTGQKLCLPSDWKSGLHVSTTFSPDRTDIATRR